jgi:hypothetical protein
VNGRRGGEIFYHFLNKVFDRSEQEVTEVLPKYLEDLVKSKVLDQRSFNLGISKYLNAVPNIAADYPKLAQWLSLVLQVLYESKAISFKDITWIDKKKAGAEDEEPMVEDYFKVAGHFLYRLAQSGSTPE